MLSGFPIVDNNSKPNPNPYSMEYTYKTGTVTNYKKSIRHHELAKHVIPIIVLNYLELLLEVFRKDYAKTTTTKKNSLIPFLFLKKEGKIRGSNREMKERKRTGRYGKEGGGKGEGEMNYQPKYPPHHQAGLYIILPLSKTLLKYLKEVSVSEGDYRSFRND